jgi:hypothetical protein
MQKTKVCCTAVRELLQQEDKKFPSLRLYALNGNDWKE